MRKIVAAILAVPVLVVLYLPVLGRRGTAIRTAVAAGAGLLILAAALAALPHATSALPPATAGPARPATAGPARPATTSAPTARPAPTAAPTSKPTGNGLDQFDNRF